MSATATITQTKVISQIRATPFPHSYPDPPVPRPPTVPHRLRLLIADRWYDLTHWQHSHPGGAAILHHLNGQDATDAFYSLHSRDAIDRLNTQLKPLSVAPTQTERRQTQPSNATISFRKLREQLLAAGYFNRSFAWECFYQLSVYTLAAIGTVFAAYGYVLLPILFIGLAMQQAGWIGHDYVHGRGPYQKLMGRSLSAFINAFSPTWWSHKHNTHHVFTNHVGVDLDIENDPVFHLFFPKPEHDVWFRRYQHLYFVPVASFLFTSWRIQSLVHAIKTSNYLELALMIPNYLWLYYLGWYIAVGSVLLGGVLVAVIVTATHQSEDMFDVSDQHYSFVEAQFNSTRDAICDTFLMEWLWGGMQYQLEHHLFPTMPKYHYSRIRPILQNWAKQNNIEYRAESVWAIWYRNYQTLKAFAQDVHHNNAKNE